MTHTKSDRFAFAATAALMAYAVVMLALSAAAQGAVTAPIDGLAR